LQMFAKIAGLQYSSFPLHVNLINPDLPWPFDYTDVPPPHAHLDRTFNYFQRLLQ